MFKAVPHGGNVFLRATQDDENYAWTERIEQALPNGMINIAITNEEQYQKFKVGDIYQMTMYKVS
jgi:hypothetical protein